MTGTPVAAGRGLRIPGWQQSRLLVGLVISAVIVVVLPHVMTDRFYLYSLTLGAMYLVAVFGLNALADSGIISMGTAAFMTIGAYTVGLTQIHWHLHPFLACLLAIVVCAVVGAVTAFPALRLGVFAVAVITLMYAQVVAGLALHFQSFTGGGSGVQAHAAHLSPIEFWYLSCGVAAVIFLGHRALLHSPMGRAWSVGRRSEPVAASLGIATGRMKLVAFAISAATGGLSGALYQLITGVVTTETFTITISISLLLMMVLGGEGTVNGPVLGTLVLTIIPMVLNQTVSAGGNERELVYGIILLLVVLIVPTGLAGIGARVKSLVSRRVRAESAGAAEAAGAHAAGKQSGTSSAVDFGLLRDVIHEVPEPATLEVRTISKAIGGLQILREAAFTVNPGTIHGLIGPNGSGKTTLLNSISGVMKINSGAILVDGRSLPGSAAQHARAGLGRTFQTALLVETASVRDNLLSGVDAHRRASYVEYCLRLPRALREARASKLEVERWARALGLRSVLDNPVSSLTPRERRLVEVGRALATHPRVLLMDEPVAGLAEGEVDELEELIRLLRTCGITVVLVEHHADLVMRLCDRVTVLDLGRTIITDEPATVSADPRVVAAYLGDELSESKAESL